MSKKNKNHKKQSQKRNIKSEYKNQEEINIFRQVLLFGWMGIILLVPYLRAKTFDVFSAPKFFVILITIIILSAIAAISILNSRSALPKIRWNKFILFYSAIFLVSTIFSVDRHISIFGSYPNFHTGIIPYLLCVIFFYIVLISRPTIAEIKVFLKCMAFSGILVAIQAIFERFAWFHVGIPRASVVGRAIGMFGNSDYTFSYLLFVLPLICYFATQEKQKFIKWSYFVSILTTIFGLFVLSPINLQLIIIRTIKTIPGALLILFFVILLFILYRKKQALYEFIIHHGYKKILLLTLVLLPIILPLIYRPVKKPVIEFLSGPANEQRFWAWKAGLEVGKKYLLFGSGPATISYFLPAFQKEHPTETWDDNKSTDNLHNEALDNFAMMGIFGLIGYLLLWGSLFYYLIRAIKDDRQEKKLLLAIFVSLILFIGFNQLFFSTAGTMLLPWLSAALTFIIAGEIDYTFLKKNKAIWKVVGICLAVFVAIFLLFWGIRYWIADYYYGKANKSQESGYVYSEKSIKLFPFIDVYWRHYGYNLYYDSLVYKLKAHNLYLSEEDQKFVLQNSSDALKKSIEIRPKMASHWLAYGSVLLRLSQFDKSYEPKAMDVISKSLELEENNNANTYIQIAEVFRQMGDFKNAKNYLDNASLICTERTKYTLLIAYASLHYAEGEKAKAIEEYKEALKYIAPGQGHEESQAYDESKSYEELKAYIDKLEAINSD